jgi:hypothetical protein
MAHLAQVRGTSHSETPSPLISFFSFYSIEGGKLGRFGQQIRNTWKVLKCGAEEGWRRSVG